VSHAYDQGASTSRDCDVEDRNLLYHNLTLHKPHSSNRSCLEHTHTQLVSERRQAGRERCSDKNANVYSPRRDLKLITLCGESRQEERRRETPTNSTSLGGRSGRRPPPYKERRRTMIPRRNKHAYTREQRIPFSLPYSSKGSLRDPPILPISCFYTDTPVPRLPSPPRSPSSDALSGLDWRSHPSPISLSYLITTRKPRREQIEEAVSEWREIQMNHFVYARREKKAGSRRRRETNRWLSKTRIENKHQDKRRKSQVSAKKVSVLCLPACLCLACLPLPCLPDRLLRPACTIFALRCIVIAS